jgi:hypothetical protein
MKMERIAEGGYVLEEFRENVLTVNSYLCVYRLNENIGLHVSYNYDLTFQLENKVAWVEVWYSRSPEAHDLIFYLAEIILRRV